MTKRVQHVRHDNAGSAAFLGKIGELTVNTGNKSVHVHDGINEGGTEQARADLVNVAVATAGNVGKMSAQQAAELAQALLDIVTNASGVAANLAAILTNDTDITNLQNTQATKADKLVPATTNNVAVLDAAGNLADGLQTIAELLARANHTGTQTLATISDSGALAALSTITTAYLTNDSVTLAKMANMATDSFIGRDTAGTGDPEILSATQVRTIINVENGADVTDTANVTAAGALMDSEVDADLKTFSLPASTTISAFGRTLIDDAAASNARTTLGLGTIALKNTIGQNELNVGTGSGSISLAQNVNGSIVIAGGSWAWWTASGAGLSTDGFGFGGSDTAAGTLGLLTNDLGGGTFHYDSRYMQASPPYNLGDGDIPLFIFVLIEKSTGDIKGHYAAQEAPWHYNGKTNIRASRKEGARSWSTMTLIEAELLDAKKSVSEAVVAGMYSYDVIADRLIADELVEVELTQAIKNTDMIDIPHPFLGNNITNYTVVMLDPVKTEKLLALHKAGESISKLLYNKKIVVSNNFLPRRTPVGVKAVGFTL